MFKGKLVPVSNKESKKVITKINKLGVVIYKNDVFKCISKNIEYDIDGYNFKDARFLYSKPNNTSYSAWTRINNVAKDSKYLTIVAQFWSTLYPGQKVFGDTENNTFIIR